MDRKREQDGERGEDRTHDLSRRDFLEGTGAALVVAGTTPSLAAADSRRASADDDRGHCLQEAPPRPHDSPSH